MSVPETDSVRIHLKQFGVDQRPSGASDAGAIHRKLPGDTIPTESGGFPIPPIGMAPYPKNDAALRAIERLSQECFEHARWNANKSFTSK
jgi:hypothetical protein